MTCAPLVGAGTPGEVGKVVGVSHSAVFALKGKGFLAMHTRLTKTTLFSHQTCLAISTICANEPSGRTQAGF